MGKKAGNFNEEKAKLISMDVLSEQVELERSRKGQKSHAGRGGGKMGAVAIARKEEPWVVSERQDPWSETLRCA